LSYGIDKQTGQVTSSFFASMYPPKSTNYRYTPVSYLRNKTYRSKFTPIGKPKRRTYARRVTPSTSYSDAVKEKAQELALIPPGGYTTQAYPAYIRPYNPRYLARVKNARRKAYMRRKYRAARGYGFGDSRIKYPRVEYKMLTTYQVGAPNTGTPGTVGNTPSILALCEPSQGTDFDERIGDKIFMYGVDIRCSVILDTTSDYAKKGFRMIVFIDKYCDGTQPTVAQLLAYTSGDGLMVERQNSPQYRGRFQVLLDKTVVRAFTAQGNFYFRKYFKLKGHRQNITAGGAAAQGGLFMLVTSSDVDVTANISTTVKYLD
jgi:hypothetical protein